MSIAQQAAARGEPHPINRTAAECRKKGYVIPDVVPDTAIYLPENRLHPGTRVIVTELGHTGFVWYWFR